MQIRVREQGDEVHIELTGVAGRQQHVLQALNECQRAACSCSSEHGLSATEVSVRADSNGMRIRLKSRDGMRFEANAVYRCLRHALLERGRAAPASGITAA